MLGLGDLSRVMGPEGLRLVAAEGDEPKKDAPKDKKKDDKKGAPEPPALPDGALGEMGGAPLMPMGPKFGPGTEVRDIFSGATGTVAEPPAGDFGDIVFVTFDGETHPIRGDQLEAVGGAPMGGPAMGALPGAGAPMPLGEGMPAPGSPIPGAPAEELSTKPQALPDVTKASLKASWEQVDEKNGKKLWIDRSKSKKGNGEFADDDVHPLTVTEGDAQPGKPMGYISWDEFKTGTGKSVAWSCVASLKAAEGELRAVRVTFADGNTIETNMAAGLSDEEILQYYAVGKEFNVGAGENDNMQAVTKVEILAGLKAEVTENPDVTVQNNGSIIVVNFVTPAAKAWKEENIGATESWQMVGPDGVAIEPRYADAILEGLAADGLVVAQESTFRGAKKDDAPKPTPKMKTGKKVRVKDDCVTAALDPRRLTYSAFLGALKADKDPTHQLALNLIGYVPNNWDLLVARLAKDGVALVSPKGSYDVMGLLKKGHNAEEVRTLLAAKGVPVYSIDAVLKMVGGDPTTPMPTTPPGANMVWGWRDDLKMWVAVPAKAGAPGAPLVTTAAAQGPRMDFSGFAPGQTWWGVSAPSEDDAADIASDVVDTETKAEFATLAEAIEFFNANTGKFDGGLIDLWELDKDGLPYVIQEFNTPEDAQAWAAANDKQ